MQTNFNCEFDGFRTDLEGKRAKQEIDVYDTQETGEPYQGHGNQK